jgi:replicative DNA helicase
MELTNYNKDRKKGRRQPAIDISTMVYGKVPPQAKDLEEAIIGALMLDSTAFDLISELLIPEMFYVDSNQRVFRAIKTLVLDNKPADILTVVHQLRTTEELDLVGGPYYVTKLTNAIVSTANLIEHSRIVIQQFIKRELIRISGEIIGDAYEDATDCFSLLDDALLKLEKLDAGLFKKDAFDMPQCSMVFQTSLDKKINNNGELSGVTSGFRELDYTTHGWQPTDLIILAARPGIGKTALSLNFAMKAAKYTVKPTPVALFNLEMSANQLIERIVSAWGEIPLKNIRQGKLDEQQSNLIYRQIMPRLEKVPLYIDDTANLTWLEFRTKARRLKKKYKIGLFIIDYLQLMSDVQDGEKRNREQQIANITRNLKKIAKELETPIIALSQLSRAVETRKEKHGEPVLSDLRESGAIEQDADLVAFIYKPDDNDDNPMNVTGKTIIKIAKHRNGTLDKITLIGKLHVQKFFNPDDEKLKDGKLISEPPPGGYKTNDFTEGVKDKDFEF